MSQRTVVSQRTPTGSLLRRRVRPPSGDEAVPYGQASHDIRTHVMDIASGIDVGALTTPPAPTMPWGKALDVLKVFAIPVPFALSIGATFWVIGVETLKGTSYVVPFTLADLARQAASVLVGSSVGTLVVGAVAVSDLPFRVPHGLDHQSIAERLDGAVPVIIGALSGVLGMPLCCAMVPYPATETFGAWHALVVTATGLGVFGMMCVGVFLVVVAYTVATEGL